MPKLFNISIHLICLIFIFFTTKHCFAMDMKNWVSIDIDGVFFVNKFHFPRDRHLRRVLEIQNFNQRAVDGVNSMELFTEYDCKKGTFRLLTHRAFSNKNLNGDLIYDWQDFDPRAFVGIPTNSPAERVLYLVCGYERKT